MNESEFNRTLPEGNYILNILIQALQQNSSIVDKNLASILNGARGSFHPTTTYTRKRWNEYHCTFQININHNHILEYFKEEMTYTKRLESLSNQLIPYNSGYLLSVKVGTSSEESSNLPVQVSNIITNTENPIFNRIVDELQKKGREMGEVYLAIYYIENSLRHFIDEIFKENYGENYSLMTYLSKPTQNGIIERRKKDERNKWLDKRGASDLSYLDFTDITAIINKNWSIFEVYFPDQNWLKVKLDELGQIRNLVAHNSYVSSDGIEIALSNYKQIMKQIEHGNEA